MRGPSGERMFCSDQGGPNDYYVGEEVEPDKHPIYVQRRNGRLAEISRQSEAIRAIAGRRETKERICVPAQCRESIEELVQLGLLREKAVSRGYLSYEYELSEAALVDFSDEIARARRYESLVTRIVEEDARLLELAATLHYFIRSGYDQSQAETETKRVKPDKHYSPEEMRRAWSFLNRLECLVESVSTLE